MIYLLSRCYLVLTDSGGIQEEALSFNKPVLIMRKTTERIEIIQAGGGKLVGTNENHIVESVQWLLEEKQAYRHMAMVKNPFGDGHASERIVQQLCK